MGTEARSPAAHWQALVLAAGLSVRFGAPKLLAPWRGGLLIDGALEAAFAAPVARVIVVTGGHAAGVTAAAEAFAARAGQSSRLALVHAADHGEGLSASLRAGIASLPEDTDGVFVFLADMPGIPPGVAPALIAALTGDHDAAAPMFEARRGHPVLLGRALFEPIRRLTGDHGAGHLLKGLGERLALVPVEDPGILKDIDRPEDL
ncbi:MAG: molybdopterin-guanine dinucleotide biosynthesis protein [Caulobacter sp.]|nr:molybdopterin-guanine dinucleotide biosynthesis protein [Caulobacter sp.]